MNQERPSLQKIQERSQNFALRIINLYAQLPTKTNKIAQVIGDQVLRSGTSIGAQLCEAQAPSSRKDFIYKVEMAEKEARETQYWLWLLSGSTIFPETKRADLYEESSQIVAIGSTIGKNTRAKGIRGKVVSLLCLLLGM